METVSSNYPGYFQSDTDKGETHAAVLTSHAAASVERNQDAQFSAGRDMGIAREVVGGTKDARIESLTNRYELAIALKDSEIRQSERLSRIEALLAGQASAQLSRELAEVKADGRSSKLEALLAQIVDKLPTT